MAAAQRLLRISSNAAGRHARTAQYELRSRRVYFGTYSSRSCGVKRVLCDDRPRMCSSCGGRREGRSPRERSRRVRFATFRAIRKPAPSRTIIDVERIRLQVFGYDNYSETNETAIYFLFLSPLSVPSLFFSLSLARCMRMAGYHRCRADSPRTSEFLCTTMAAFTLDAHAL